MPFDVAAVFVGQQKVGFPYSVLRMPQQVVGLLQTHVFVLRRFPLPRFQVPKNGCGHRSFLVISPNGRSSPTPS